MSLTLDNLGQHYDSVWCVDFEYNTGISGADAPSPICMVARELFSGQTIREWLWDGPVTACPIPTDNRSLYIAFYASAEITCHLGLGWPVPTRILDLYAEFRCIANSATNFQIASPEGKTKGRNRLGLLNCMRTFGLGAEAVTTGYKDEARELCMRGGPFSEAERTLILEYCESDVIALTKLLPRMLGFIEFHPALFRGRYMAAVAAMERRGIPIDQDLAKRFRDHWPLIIERLIVESKDELDVIGKRDIDQRKFGKWLNQNGLIANWPRSESKVRTLRSDSDTLADWAKFSPQVMRLKEFLVAVRRTRLFDKLEIGSDGRNRFLISPFGSKTSRNQPSNARSVFGPACWVRLLIQPPPGYALLYCDWSGQEYGEAAYFSDDPKMIADYANDDPYLGFAKRIKLAPEYATKQSHSELRTQLKVAAGLGVLYGAGAPTVARAGNMTESQSERVLREHRYTYPQFWRWREQVINHARLAGELRTCLGWKWRVCGDDSTNSISNWMMQAHGADMLRVACCLAVERGIEVCTPVHDALLVLAPIDAIEDVRNATVACMEEASSVVLGGPKLKVGVDAPIVYPNHFSDSRGVEMWEKLHGILVAVEKSGT
jgi:hypothetical protein